MTTALPAKSTFDGTATPTTSTMKTALGNLHDFLSGLLGTTGAWSGFSGIFDLSNAAAGQIKFPATQNPSADANTLDDYEEGTFTGTCTGFNAGVTRTFRYVKVGGMVTLSIDGNSGRIEGTSNAATKTVTGIPATLYPTAHRYFVAAVADNGGTFVSGFLEVNTSGVISVFKDLSGSAWTASGTAYIYPNCITYPI